MNKTDKKEVFQKGRNCFLVIPFLFASFNTFGQTSEAQEMVQNKAQDYQNCVVQVMSTLETAAQKRESISISCGVLRAELSEMLPEMIRELALTQIDRRVEASLFALEEIEGRVTEDVGDAIEIQQELESIDS